MENDKIKKAKLENKNNNDDLLPTQQDDVNKAFANQNVETPTQVIADSLSNNASESQNVTTITSNLKEINTLTPSQPTLYDKSDPNNKNGNNDSTQSNAATTSIISPELTTPKKPSENPFQSIFITNNRFEEICQYKKEKNKLHF